MKLVATAHMGRTNKDLGNGVATMRLFHHFGPARRITHHVDIRVGDTFFLSKSRFAAMQNGQVGVV